MVIIHRRARIINALAELFAQLIGTDDPEDDDNWTKLNRDLPPERQYPMPIKTVQKRFVHWTALDQQDALPAILLTYGDDGRAPDSDVVGYIDEQFPIAVTAVMKEAPGQKELTDQASDIHYSLGRLINENPTLGVEGVNPEKTRIMSWRGSEGAISKFEIIRFRVLVVHRYLATEDV